MKGTPTLDDTTVAKLETSSDLNNGGQGARTTVSKGRMLQPDGRYRWSPISLRSGVNLGLYSISVEYGNVKQQTLDAFKKGGNISIIHLKTSVCLLDGDEI